MGARATAWLFLLLLTASFVPAVAWARTEPAQPDSSIINPERARQKVAAARELAGQSRHREAAGLYLDALAHDASLVPEVAQEIGYQKLWWEDAEKARFYFRRYLARHPDRDNRDVRKGLALATSWSGRQPEAVAMYRQLVAEDESDGETRMGLGRSLIWDNRLHEGFGVLRTIETEFDAEHPARREAGDFLLTVLDGYTPHLDVRLDASWDSDDLDITRLSAHGALTVWDNKLLQIMPSYAWYRRPEQPGIDAPRLGAGFVAALARNWAVHAYAWLDMFHSSAPLFGGTEKLDWNRVGGDAWVTWLPMARWRLDLGASSQAVETFYALNNHIHFEQASLSGDWRFARSWVANLSGSLADYSDGNSRSRSRATVRWRRDGRFNYSVGAVFMYMDFEIPYPGGYWAPDWVRNGTLEAAVTTRTRVMTYRLSAGIGREQETGTDGQTVGSAAGRVGWRFKPGWLAAAELGYSKSSFASASGYSRTFANLSVRALF